MKATEFRVGNLIDDCEDGIFAIEQIGIFPLEKEKGYISYRNNSTRCLVMDDTDSGFSPITITENRLLAAGFELERAGLWGNCYRIGAFTLALEKDYYTLVCYPKVKLKFIHELQNVFFALEKGELTFDMRKMETPPTSR